MYANSYGSLSNNPFLEDPTTAHARFPDLSVVASNGYPNHPPQYQQHYQQQSYSPGYHAPPQAIALQNQFTSASYTPQFQGPQPTGIGAFQPITTGFPPQQHQHYPSYPMTYASAGYTQPANATPNYLAEFDPYSQSQSQAQAQRQHSPSPGGGGTAPPGITHPRDVIRIHKSGLEAWDTYSWKQLFSACDTLKDAWLLRKQQAESVVRQYGGVSDPGLFGPDPAFGYNSQVEGWKQVLKDANDHLDTVVACTFQLHEVFNSYRQSGDPASKRRVRESCNAAVKGLPDWPSN